MTFETAFPFEERLAISSTGGSREYALDKGVELGKEALDRMTGSNVVRKTFHSAQEVGIRRYVDVFDRWRHRFYLIRDFVFIRIGERRASSRFARIVFLHGDIGVIVCHHDICGIDSRHGGYLIGYLVASFKMGVAVHTDHVIVLSSFPVHPVLLVILVVREPLVHIVPSNGIRANIFVSDISGLLHASG